MFFSTTAGEPHDAAAASIQQVEDRWEQVNRMLAETQRMVLRNIETKAFYAELTALLDLVAGYEKWVNTVEKIADEEQEISKQLDQCKVRQIYLVGFLFKGVGGYEQCYGRNVWCAYKFWVVPFIVKHLKWLSQAH